MVGNSTVALLGCLVIGVAGGTNGDIGRVLRYLQGT